MPARFLRTPLLQPTTPKINPAANATTPKKNSSRSAIEIKAPMIDSAIEAVDQSNPRRWAGGGGATGETIGGECSAPTMAAMHFVLVHGAYHGAWCWDLLRRDLEADGHSTSAVDLPNEDPHAGAERYADEVLAVVPKTPDGIVLVGHSLAGLTIPIVAARAKTRLAIYLCALIPIPGLSFDAQHADLDAGFRPSEPPVENPDGSASWPVRGAVETFYHDCDPDIAIASARRLRPQQWLITQEVTPLRAWPAVRSAYIMCAEDRAVSRAYSAQAAMELLRVEAIEMPGGHSPFLSRPHELAARLALLVSQ